MSLYEATLPLNQKQLYGPNETVDFRVSFMGKAIIPGTIKLCGLLKVKYDGTNVVSANEDVKMDNEVGCHSLFNQITTQLNGMMVENFQSYPRYVKHNAIGSKSYRDLYTSGKHTMEGRCENESQTLSVLCGRATDNNLPFTVVPMICLNQASNLLSYSKTGDIVISLRLSSVSDCLYGEDVSSQTTYELSDLKIHYQVVQDTKEKAPLSMSITSFVRQTVSSTVANMTVNCPTPSSSLSISVIPSTYINNYQENSLECSVVPGLERVEYTISDSFTELISYPLLELEEIEYNALAALSPNGLIGKSLVGFKRPYKNFLLGLSYVGLQANAKVGVYLQSGISENYSVFLFFKGIVSI